ncbi:NAD(P)/FAD-dependent oxidoreductase [Dactylosporangium maewongense]|uniref:NAD(P)/FAD-dependent oxidoreductase n=1 Tax=Dactylosporangium maewongense TaxID=634393 RepID=A0ABN2CKZ7_9ACTN
MESNRSSSTHIVIVGGGFAGVACAKVLAEDSRTRVTLVDQNGYHQFQPLLYQVATAELAGRDMAFDHTEVFRGQDAVTLVRSEVVAADADQRSVTLSDGGTITGDYLVLAAGAQPNFFHTPGAQEFAFPLYSLTDARRVRERVLQLFADASAKPELIDEGALNFVIVGGGPTGVEIAGALSELVYDVMPHRYPNLAVAGARIILVDLGRALLAPFSDESHTYAATQLQQRGVELRLGTAVTEVARDHVSLRDKTTIPTHLVIWGGGESASAIAGNAGIGQGRGGRIDVRPDLSVPGHPNVFAVGDVANIPHGDERALPQLGSVAQQSGAWAAKNIIGDIGGTGRESFHYRDKGIMAMIGRKAAVAEIGPHRHELHGRLAFASWLGVHAELLANAGAELRAFVAWAEEFYFRPHHRSAELLDPEQVELPRIHWGQSR